MGVVGVACAINFFLNLRPKPVGLPEPLGMVCAIAVGALWDTLDWQLEMDVLSRLGIGCNEILDVWAQQVVPWVAPWVAPSVAPACAGHGCGGPLDVLI